MHSSDLADSPLASEWPDIAEACDKPADLLREALAPFIPRHFHGPAFSAIDAVCARADFAGGAVDRMQIERETLRKVFGDTRLADEVRMTALSAAIASGDPLFGRSYQYYADQMGGVTRACLQAKAREVQKKFGLRAGRDKKDSARAKSKENATGPRADRPPAKTSGILRGGRRRMWSFFPGV